MEFNEVVVKENLGLCRCCLSEGCYKDVCTEYTWMNETEIYAEMLMDCFDISIMQHSDGPNGASRLICEVCITRLRDACNFKKQVQETEKKFIDMISKGEFQPKALQEMKSEVEVEVEPETENTVNAEYLEDEMDFSEAVKEDSDSDYEQPGVSRAATPPKKKRLKKIKIEPPKKGVRYGKNKEIKQNLATILAKLLEYTTVIPFKWDKAQKYLCFHCPQLCVSSTELKKHNIDAHDTPALDYQSPVFAGKTYIKLDITKLACKLCCKPMVDLNQFFTHAAETHSISFDEKYKRKFFQFKLDDEQMKCLECGMSFKFFSQLLKHTHKEHYDDLHTYLCNHCGKRFLTQANVKSHIKQRHQKHCCTKCDKSFESRHNLESHNDAEHRAENLKCPYCPELLGSRFLKNRHIALVHDVKSSQFACDHCSKIFSHKSARWVHVRRVHLKEKRSSCEICGYQAFDDSGIRRHKLSHTDFRPYQCKICTKSYRRNRNLKKHLLKEHPGSSQ